MFSAKEICGDVQNIKPSLEPNKVDFMERKKLKEWLLNF